MVFIPKVALGCASGRPVIYSIMFQAFSACVNHIHILDYSNTCTSLLSFCAWEDKLTFADSSLSSSLQASENSTVKCDKMSKNIHRIVKKTETLQVRTNVLDLLLLLLTPWRVWADRKAKDGQVVFLWTWLLRSGWGNNEEVTFQSSLTMQTGLPLSPVGQRHCGSKILLRTHTHIAHWSIS